MGCYIEDYDYYLNTESFKLISIDEYIDSRTKPLFRFIESTIPIKSYICYCNNLELIGGLKLIGYAPIYLYINNYKIKLLEIGENLLNRKKYWNIAPPIWDSPSSLYNNMLMRW